MEQGTSIVIPWRQNNCEWRKKSFDCVLDHMKKYNPIVSDDLSDPFSRSGSRNLGASLCNNDIIMFLDADTLIPHDQIDEAIQLAKEGYIVHPFSMYHSLSLEGTKNVYKGNRPSVRYSDWHINWATGGAVAMSRDIFFDYGQYDTDFVDWGFEDSAMLFVRKLAGIEVKRTLGNCYHLWHPRPTDQEAMDRNQKLYEEKYLALQSDIINTEDI